MFNDLPPEVEEAPALDLPEAGASSRGCAPTMLELIDEIANAMGVWGPEDNIRVKPFHCRKT